MTSRVEARLEVLDLTLPTPPEAVGSYVPATRMGNLIVTSGQLPVAGKEVMFKGKVGGKLHEEEGSYAARLCCLNALAQIKHLIGDLDKVKRVIRVEGYVASAPDFHQQAQVVNGASNLLTELYGDAGKHTRVSVGVAELPLNAAVELVLWVEVE